jgi:hypothetical protein
LRNRFKIASLVVILFSEVFAGLTCGQTEDSIESKYIYNMEQNVKGAGFFSSYQSTDLNNLGLSNTAHGSGSYDYESKLDSRKGVKFDTKKNDYTTVSDRGTVFIESADFSYSPSRMQLGKYSMPIAFQSKGAEETCLKNYISGTSMNARFNYVDTLSKNLSAELYWKFINVTDGYESRLESQTRTNLNFESSFSGSGHVGVLDMGKGQKNADVLIDEDYRGTYYLTKNMSHEAKYKLLRQIDDWLPCCSGGFADMNVVDKNDFKSAAGVFDCTCFKAADRGQFQRIY